MSLLLPQKLTESKLCSPERTADFQAMIDDTINEDITYQSQPLDLRNQRTYAIKVSNFSSPVAYSETTDRTL